MTGSSGSLLGRAATIGRVLVKAGLKMRDAKTQRARAQALKAAMEELGPTFAKLGQILSTRPDLLPREFILELASLQDQVPPLTEAQVVAVMEEELGVPWEDVFASIEPEPLAAGTIGQVHRATLEGGDRVVVKVQRPGAEDEITRDLGLLELFSEKAEGRAALTQIVDIPAAIKHLSESLRRELDFRTEAANGKRLREVLKPYERLDVPGIHDQLTTKRLLVLEMIDGVPIGKAPEGESRKDGGKQLLEAYYQQVLVDGFFHADPHPGNLMWGDDKIWFLDCGMVGEIEPRTRELLMLLLLSFWQNDSQFLSEVMLLIADDKPVDLDLGAFEDDLNRVVAQYRNLSLKDIQLGPLLQSLTELAARHRVKLPAALALTGKAFAQMQLATAELDPTLDPFKVAGDFLMRTYVERARSHLNPQKLGYQAQKLNVRATRLVEAFERVTGARPGPPFQVQLRGLQPLEDTIRRATRRLSLAALAAAAIIGAAMTAASSSVETWIPLTLGVAAGALSALLVGELLRR